MSNTTSSALRAIADAADAARDRIESDVQAYGPRTYAESLGIIGREAIRECLREMGQKATATEQRTWLATCAGHLALAIEAIDKANGSQAEPGSTAAGDASVSANLRVIEAVAKELENSEAFIRGEVAGVGGFNLVLWLKSHAGATIVVAQAIAANQAGNHDAIRKLLLQAAASAIFSVKMHDESRPLGVPAPSQPTYDGTKPPPANVA